MVQLILSLLLLSSCFTRPAAMTTETYSDIQLGTTVADLESVAGIPYAIHSRGPSKQEYEYVERIELAPSLTYDNHYFIMVDNGIVTQKRYKRERPPSYDFIYSDDPNVFNNY